MPISLSWSTRLPYPVWGLGLGTRLGPTLVAGAQGMRSPKMCCWQERNGSETDAFDVRKTVAEVPELAKLDENKGWMHTKD